MSYSFATPWTGAHEAPLSMEFSRQEYCGGLPFPSTGDLPDPGMEHTSPAWQADSLPLVPPGKPHPSLIVVKYEGRAKHRQTEGKANSYYRFIS